MKKLFREKSHMISKLFVYQIALSLLGIFIVSPFSGKTSIIAGVFSILFYLSLVSYAVVEDGQKDFISKQANRLDGNAYTGFKYAMISYIPTIVITVIYSIIKLSTQAEAFLGLKYILNIIIRFFLMGSYIGIDVGLTGYSYDSATQSMVSSAPESVRFISDSGLFFVLCLIVMPIVCGVAYGLSFKGKISVNTQKKTK